MECNDTYPQIYQDLEPFKEKKIDMDKYNSIIIEKYNKRFSQSLCNYVIKDNKVFKRDFSFILN